MPSSRESTQGRAKSKRMAVDDVVERVDAVLLAVEGAARLAWGGEQSEEATLVTIQVAAILDLAAEKLNLLSRKLAGSKDG